MGEGLETWRLRRAQSSRIGVAECWAGKALGKGAELEARFATALKIQSEIQSESTLVNLIQTKKLIWTARLGAMECARPGRCDRRLVSVPVYSSPSVHSGVAAADGGRAPWQHRRWGRILV